MSLLGEIGGDVGSRPSSTTSSLRTRVHAFQELDTYPAPTPNFDGGRAGVVDVFTGPKEMNLLEKQLCRAVMSGGKVQLRPRGQSNICVKSGTAAMINGIDNLFKWYRLNKQAQTPKDRSADITSRARRHASVSPRPPAESTSPAPSPPAPRPFAAAQLPARLTEIADTLLMGAFPKMLLMTRDQLKMLEVDNVVSPEALAAARTLAGLGLEARAIESVVPTYLYRFRKTGQFDRGRVAS